MTIRQSDVNYLLVAINELKQQSSDMKMITKYNLLKLEEILSNEAKIAIQLMNELKEKYGEKDNNGNYLINDKGGIKIKTEDKEKVQKEVFEFNNSIITLPDLYFNLDDFADANLSWESLQALMPFIKE